MSTPQPPRHKHEKGPTESKKFLAWFISEMTWKALLVVALVVWKDDLSSVAPMAWWLLLAIVVTAGFIGIGFILGQAALDKYVRVAEIAADELRERLSAGKGNNKQDPPAPPPAEAVEATDPTDPKVNT